MSKYMTAPLYNNRGLENQLKNLTFQAHDLICGCQKPALHLQHLFTEECHHTAEFPGNATTTIGTEDAVDGLTGAELEKLFSENNDQDDSG